MFSRCVYYLDNKVFDILMHGVTMKIIINFILVVLVSDMNKCKAVRPMFIANI
jgi:hypothetical protein